MNRASRGWGIRLVWAVAVVGVATAALPARADSDLPPFPFDLGGETEAEVLATFHEVFSGPVLVKVPVEQVMDKCSALQMQRYGTPFPAIEPGGQLLGCLIRGNRPVIVYPDDPARPELTHQILRHEIGHLLGWPDSHIRKWQW